MRPSMRRFSVVAAIAAFAIGFFLASRANGVDTDGKTPKDPADRSKVPIEAQPTDPKAVKIVLICAPSLANPSGDHEYFAGCALLMRMLQQTPGVAPVLVENGWPSNPQTLANARTVVFYMDGGPRTSPVIHAAEIQKLMNGGVGIVHLHQVIEYPAGTDKQAMQWLGGVFDPAAAGNRGHWKESFDHFPEHEITRGVEPFALTDGWIFKLRFVPEAKGITPLLRSTRKSAKAAPDKPPGGTDDIVCWAYERADGGRAFVLTGGHAHKNWGITSLRRLVVNGILWSAKVEVPRGGAPVDLDPADLMTNLDVKRPKEAKPAKAAPR